MKTDVVSFYDFPAIDRLGKASKIDPHRVRRARIAFFKKALGSEAALAEIPESVRGQWKNAVVFSPLELVRRLESRSDEAEKLVFRIADGFSIESVIMRPKTGRVALCVSSQVGCAAACRFCATGQMGVAKNLTAGQIAAQVVAANGILRGSGKSVRNIVFMGMGEPMHNADAVRQALAMLTDSAAFHHPPSRILVSTVGVCEPWIETATLFPSVNYALSLHSAIERTRRALIPLAGKHSLPELRLATQRINDLQPLNKTVMVEYLMIERVTDSDDELAALLGWLDGLRVHLNLIPYNPIADAPDLRRSPREVIERFGERLRRAGYATTIRYSLGQDIEAACGQLVRDENRALRRAQMAAASPDGAA